MNFLSDHLNELESKVSKSEILNLAISSSPVGWHIEHTLLTINVIIDGLKKSDPNNYEWKFSIKKFFVFALRKIPRGKAQAPVSVQPKKDFTIETLKKHLGVAKSKLSVLQTLHSKNYIDHPVFGKLNLKDTIKFLEIHTKHHIDIINDIINRSSN